MNFKNFFLRIEKKIRITIATNYLRNHNLLNIIESSSSNKVTTGIDLYDFYLIAKIIKDKKVNTVLELGCGRSSFLIAECLKRYSKKPLLISMEENSYYYEKQKECFPFEQYPFTKLILSQRKQKKYSFFIGWGYDKVPDYNYDLVFVDGPFTKDDDKIYDDEPDRMNFDLLDVVLKSKRRLTAIIDGRAATRKAYEILFKDNYKFIKSMGVGLINDIDINSLKVTKSNRKKNYD